MNEDNLKLISDEYKILNQKLHKESEDYGASGDKIVSNILSIYDHGNYIKSILDYGCGKGNLKKELIKNNLPKNIIYEYDPCISGKDSLPKKTDLVICSDVLEHIEPDLLDNVLNHIYSLINKKLYLKISTKESNKILSDGRNAHLIIQEPLWWVNKLYSMNFNWQNFSYTVNHIKGSGTISPKEIIVVAEVVRVKNEI